MNIAAAFVVGVILFASGFASGWKTNSWQDDSERLGEVKQANDARDAARAERDRIANRFEGKLANLRIVNKTINNEVRHEVEKTVYGNPDCALPESGVRLRNAAIDAANGNPGKPEAALPATPKDAGQTATLR